MAEYMESLRVLTEKFGRLEGVGKKTAMRMAFSVLELSMEDAEDFANAILDAKRKIHLCPVCQNLTDRELCSVCADLSRNRSQICVVTDTRAVMSMEKVREYRGTYHVLHGVISPMNGVTPDQLKIKELLARVESGEVEEVIIATNSSLEGETTAMYIGKLIKPTGIKVTRIASGVPVGGDLEYIDEVTLLRALEGRVEL